MPVKEQLQSLVATFYCLGGGGGVSGAVIGCSVTGRRRDVLHTMLWWLFLSMMSDEESSSFLMGEGGGVVSAILGLNRSETKNTWWRKKMSRKNVFITHLLLSVALNLLQPEKFRISKLMLEFYIICLKQTFI